MTIVDCGPNTPEARDVMCAGLRRLGLTPELVRRVVLTHAHADHMGLAAWFEEQGADIYVHSLELGKLQNQAYWRAGWLRLLTESGAPEEAVNKGKSEFDSVDDYVGRLNKPPYLLDNLAELAFDAVCFGVEWLPGHSLGHVGLWHEESGLLLGGDVLLPEITPNPVPEAGPDGTLAPTLSQFLHSLERLDRLPVSLVLPGHGPALENHRRLIAHYREHHQRRLRLVAGALRQEGTSCFEVAQQVYPNSYRRQVFLTLAESHAHLQYLADAGHVQVNRRNGVAYYSPAV